MEDGARIGDLLDKLLSKPSIVQHRIITRIVYLERQIDKPRASRGGSERRSERERKEEEEEEEKQKKEGRYRCEQVF